MSGYPELDALSAITNYWDLELHIFGSIGDSVQLAQAYSVPAFLTVGYWKTRRQLANYLANEKVTITTVTGAALGAPPPPEGRRGRLAMLAGVRAPVASALLTVWHPEEFTIIDVWALATVSKFGETVDGVAFGDHSQPWWEQHL